MKLVRISYVELRKQWASEPKFKLIRELTGSLSLYTLRSIALDSFASIRQVRSLSIKICACAMVVLTDIMVACADIDFCLPKRLEHDGGLLFDKIGQYQIGQKINKSTISNFPERVCFDGKNCDLELFWNKDCVVTGMCLSKSFSGCKLNDVRMLVCRWARMMEEKYNVEMTPYHNGNTNFCHCSFSYSDEPKLLPKYATQITGDYRHFPAKGSGRVWSDGRVSIIVTSDNHFSFWPVKFLTEERLRGLEQAATFLGVDDWVDKHLEMARGNNDKF